MFKITMDASQIRLMVNWLDKFDIIAREPETMSAGVKNIGIGMQSQFRTEGRKYSTPWRALSMTTRKLRDDRGYNPEHPILVQSGILKSVTADALRAYTTSTTAMMRAGDGASMMASSMPLVFTAKASGEKVRNHWGGRVKFPDGKTGKIPSRPFFGFGDFEAQMAWEAIYRRLITQWASKSSLVKKVT